MRKTIRNGIDRRAVYKFACTGECKKVKNTYVYDRAKAGICLSCSKKPSNGDQDSLFNNEEVLLSPPNVMTIINSI